MNRLTFSTSPYLLQHANNPVDWHPWSEEALAKARAENKPIFLSIGYAACHWCHVMAHESFEDEPTAALMNEHFVNIKVDREERPDLDGIYMQAVVALTGSGGWPMSVFLTPDLRPFYGGTYFPPVPRHNLPSFRDVLTSIANAWKNRREEVDRAGTQLIQHIQSQTAPSTSAEFAEENLALAEKNILDTYDWGNGGWGAAPKFPQPMMIEFLLQRNITPGPSLKGRSESAALHALKAMARGGMYDVVGGGFSRYSTDNFWRVPHFEKMLYDNAQLVRAYLHAWQITKDPFFRRIVEETLAFVSREMTHPDGGFYSSLDADSEGVEGKFYVWTPEEIRAALAKEESVFSENTGFSNYEFFSAAYGITDKGNWEGNTVLQRALDDASLAARFNLTEEAVAAKLTYYHEKLLAARGRRVRPATDDKILTSWNGLMLAAYAEAARVLGNHGVGEHNLGEHIGSPQHGQLYNQAARNADFLLTHLRPEGQLRRSWRDGKTTHEVFLEDYAALILGLLELYQTDFDDKWFASALELAEEMIQRFRDTSGGFFDTPTDGEVLPIRSKDLQDNATPSGNALATEALLKLSALTGRGDFRDIAEAALRQVMGLAVRYPTAFGRWLSAAEFASAKVKQVAVIVSEDGQDSAREMIQTVRAEYRPNFVIAAALPPVKENAPALLRDRPLVDGKSAAYVCEGFVCLRPVTNQNDLEKLLLP
ncbi:MAG: thioredoxin domain-containing protein [Anaerolineaceae bacterium]|nr:MAG: thioredoxin domain-containing protein [Anaerolineaceae bacterium]